ncbi:MAG: 2-hydroxyacid dehydrogenase [Bacillota bacterium]|nr:2-hydroxyacid dehydrogenase [Bacillota bacterium]
MKTIAFFDAKPYDRIWFDEYSEEYGVSIRYFENRLNPDTAFMARDCDGVCAFVNDIVDEAVINSLYGNKVGVVALRSAGYNNVDFKAAYGKVHIVRVPAYSPYAVAEHAAALLLALNRKIHRAYNRTRDGNFSLNGLMGFDLHGKTAGVIGTGKIGRVFIDICRGFGMKVIAYDPRPAKDSGIEYVELPELYRQSDIISLHCPLTKDTRHIINSEALSLMRDGVFLINTSRGALIDSKALLDAIKVKKVGGAGLDVYEEEAELFFEDYSNTVIQDDVLARFVSLPNVIVTSHQGFFTEEAMQNIARTTLYNLRAFFQGDALDNEICYRCQKFGACDKSHKTRCF